MSNPAFRTLRVFVSITITVLALLMNAYATAGEPVSRLNNDDFLVFFRTSAWLDADTNYWHLPIHGWIYEPQNSQFRKAALAKVLQEKYGLKADARTEANFDRRVNLMIADNERGKQAVIRIGNRVHALPASAPNGHFEAVITLAADEAQQIATDNIITYTAVMGNHEQRSFSGQVYLAPPTGISVISDIDDTIKISHVTDHAKLLDYSFFRDFEAVPGMAALYEDWSTSGTAVHLVSSSPWQFYSLLSEFTDTAGFPWASLHLKMVRFRDETLINVFKPGTETKPGQINPILARYPGRRFVLVGDSGEQDPEVYAGIFHQHPEQIERIYIRNITNATRDDSRFASVFEGIAAERWMLFEDPSSLELP